mgnify:CR=1 FL=1
MRKITFILMALVIGFASCSDDDDDAPETCIEYANRYEKKFDALDESDAEGALALLGEFITNLPEGCEDEIDLD